MTTSINQRPDRVELSKVGFSLETHDQLQQKETNVVNVLRKYDKMKNDFFQFCTIRWSQKMHH